jgi:type IV secretory pathway VirB10-like protein
MHHKTFVRLLAAGTLLACATVAQAQYIWINEKGVKEYSDRSPPPSIPLKNILKAPNGQPTGADVAPASPAELPKPAPAPSLAERNADYNKRLKDQAELAKKAQVEADQKAEQAASCSRALAAKRSIDSGERISVQDDNGERGFMDDAQRARERARADKILAGCR